MLGKIVSFGGLHSSGKTAAVLEFAAEFKKLGINVWPIYDVARTTRLPINEKGSWLTQEVIAHRMMVRLLEAAGKHQLVITDRTPLDCLAYNLVGGVQENDPEYIRLKDLTYNAVKRHSSLLVRLMDVRQPENDGVRPVGEEFFQKSLVAFSKVYDDAERDLGIRVVKVHTFFDPVIRKNVFETIKMVHDGVI